MKCNLMRNSENNNKENVEMREGEREIEKKERQREKLFNLLRNCKRMR